MGLGSQLSSRKLPWSFLDRSRMPLGSWDPRVHTIIFLGSRARGSWTLGESQQLSVVDLEKARLHKGGCLLPPPIKGMCRSAICPLCENPLGGLAFPRLPTTSCQGCLRVPEPRALEAENTADMDPGLQDPNGIFQLGSGTPFDLSMFTYDLAKFE